MHPHMLRHSFVTTMLDAGVSLRDVQIAARHADPRTTMRYDRPAISALGSINAVLVYMIFTSVVWPRGGYPPC